MKKKKKSKTLKGFVIIEKPRYIDGKKVYISCFHKEYSNKIQLFFIKLYCILMHYKYEVV